MTENLTTYTEVDSSGRLSKTASRVSLGYLLRSEDVYLYKDFGANYFDGIHLMFDGRISTSTANDGECAVGFSNVVDDNYGWGGYGLTISFQRNHSLGKYYIGFFYWGSYDAYEISINTTYYLTLDRPAGGDTATLKIYSDSARSALLDTLSISGIGTAKWRYFYPAASCNSGINTDVFYGYFEEFRFGRSAGCGGAQIIGLELL